MLMKGTNTYTYKADSFEEQFQVHSKIEQVPKAPMYPVPHACIASSTVHILCHSGGLYIYSRKIFIADLAKSKAHVISPVLSYVLTMLDLKLCTLMA
jgi:hypothetical protein